MVLRSSFGALAVAWSWDDAPAGGRALGGLDRAAARSWLARAAADAGAVRSLRRLVAERAALPGYGLDDGAVVDLVAAWVTAGTLRLTVLPYEPLASWGDADEEEALAPAPIAAAAPAEAAPSEEPPTFGPDADAAVIAALMREAAAHGIPFCEECTRRNLRAAREAAA